MISRLALAMARLRTARELRPLFDAEFYLRANPDVAAAGMNPLDHYVKHGAAELRQPHPLFDPAHYLACCPEARAAENPLLHYARTRGGKWPSTHPLFDITSEMTSPGDVNPLQEYIAQREHPGVEGSEFGQC